MKANSDFHGTSIKLPPALLKALDKWRKQQLREPSRSEVIRLALELFLNEKAKELKYD